MKLKFLLPLTMLALLSCTPKRTEKKIEAMYSTRQEAEAAAKLFNCEGAHKMGEKWMPCNEHLNHNH